MCKAILETEMTVFSFHMKELKRRTTYKEAGLALGGGLPEQAHTVWFAGAGVCQSAGLLGASVCQQEPGWRDGCGGSLSSLLLGNRKKRPHRAEGVSVHRYKMLWTLQPREGVSVFHASLFSLWL